jgi:hypothetical protein
MSFAEFLAANPDLAAQVDAARNDNPGDPVLRNVMYNPVTGVVGPVPVGYGVSDPTPAPTGKPSGITVNQTVVFAGVALLIFAMSYNNSSPGRRR